MKLLDSLTRIGFTEYEAKVYLALLADYPTTGYQISKKSGVPRSMVYETLSRLHTRGAVMETVEGRSTLYRPLPPEILLDRQEDTHQQLINDLRVGLSELYSTPADADHIWTVNGQDAVLSYASQMMETAQTDIYLVIDDDHLDALYGDIAAACDRGVAANTLLTGERDLEYGAVVRHPPLESELQGLTNTLLMVVDSHEVLIANTGHLATITRNSNLVLIARQFVWMELFTQRIYARIGNDLLERLDPADRQIFESLSHHEGES